jgi:hypothetical protein
MKRYTYRDMEDKTREGIHAEVQRGLAVMAFYFITTKGIPKDIVREWFEETVEPLTNAAKIDAYMRFRNDHPAFCEKYMPRLAQRVTNAVRHVA